MVLLDNGLLCFGTVSHVEYVAQVGCTLANGMLPPLVMSRVCQYIPPIVLQRRGVPVGQEDKQPQLALGIDVVRVGNANYRC